MPDPNIVTRLLETPGFGWQCGEPLQDKGSYFRCSCGCSQPDANSDGYLTILQPKILREAAQEIERLRAELKVMTEEHRLACDDRDRMRAERDRARRTLCQVLVLTRSPGSKQGERGFAKEMGWDCYKQEDGK
jgi:hypothetical protein